MVLRKSEEGEREKERKRETELESQSVREQECPKGWGVRLRRCEGVKGKRVRGKKDDEKVPLRKRARHGKRRARQG